MKRRLTIEITSCDSSEGGTAIILQAFLCGAFGSTSGVVVFVLLALWQIICEDPAAVVDGPF